MRENTATTLYARLTPRQALATLLLFLALAVGGMLRPGEVRTLRLADLPRELSDSRVYRAVADRVHAGEGYYDAAADELASHGYPTGSVFNWRLPTYAWLLGVLPDASWGWYILELIVLSAIGMASTAVARDSGARMRAATAASLVVADGWIAFPEPAYFMELWAGTFVLISLCFYFNDNWVGGVAAGSIALLLRELAFPFCLIMVILAGRRRRWREVAAWAAILTAYALLFSLHSLEVGRRGAGLAPGRSLAWVTFGGVTSVLSTSRMNLLLSSLPVWVTAVYVPMALLGLLGWPARGALPMKLTAVTYLALFSMIGQPFNFYWGWLCSPILAIGIVRMPLSVYDLISVLMGCRFRPETEPSPASPRPCTG